jgi:hypothetical protein
MINKLKLFSIKALCCIVCFSAYAQDDYIKQGYVRQSRLPRSLHRFELGISTVGTSAYYKGFFDQKLPSGKESSLYHEGPSVSKGGLAFNIGTYYRLAKLGKRTAIAFDMGYMFSYMYWKGIGTGFYTEKAWTNAGSTWQMSYPVGLELKFGSDARLEKNHRFCMSFGGGIQPLLSATKLEDTMKKPKKGREFNFGYQPYVKAEMGLMLGICWKLRLMYSIGDIPLLTESTSTHKDPYTVSKFDMKGTSAVTFSIVLMPFSYDWPDNGWWNNSRTSTRMYKGWRGRNRYD